jgi:hypothetical protein
MRFSIGLKLALAGALVVALTGASPAAAASPWWHLTSGARPTVLEPGAAKNEVQEITVAPETFFELKLNGKEVGRFATEPYFAELGGRFPEPTAANVQKALEASEFYGAGNVVVAGGPGGTAPLTVTSVNEDAQKWVPTLEVASLVGTAQARVATTGRPDGLIVLTATNLGDASVNGEGSHRVTIVDKLPPGLRAVFIEGFAGARAGTGGSFGAAACSVESLTCTFAKTLPPYHPIEVLVGVDVKPGASPGEPNEASVSGGEAPAVSIRRPVRMCDEPAGVGVENYELTPEEEGGALDTQAGSHPFQLTTTLTLNQVAEETKENEGLLPQPVMLAKDLNFKLPPGLIGNPTPFPRCTLSQFLNVFIGPSGPEDACSSQTVVGVARVLVNLPKPVGEGGSRVEFVVPLFNLEPSVGEPARFGFLLGGNLPVYLDTSVRAGGDYGVTVSVDNIAQTAAFLSNQVTFWGVPGDPRHDSSRNWRCLARAAGGEHEKELCSPLEELHPPPLISLPTSCPKNSLTGAPEPLHTSVETDSWEEPRPAGQQLLFPGEPMPALDGCNALPFGPEIKVAPDGQQASRPSGLTVDVHVPQDGQLNPTGVASSNVKDISVTLPEGVNINPAGADGLQACSDGLIGFEGSKELSPESEPGNQIMLFTATLPTPLEQGVNFCPDASKIGTAKITTPLLPNPLEGAIYLAAQNANPFGSLVAMYFVAEDPVSGALVKLPGKVTLNQTTGQIVGTFENTPQLAFEDAELHFFGGERAPLAMPAHCGTYTTDATFTPWSGNAPVTSQSSFAITSGPNGSPCPGATLPFAPSLHAGSSNIQAGGFTPFTMTMSREDGNQTLQSIQLRMPLGLSGTLSSVQLCGEAQADAGTCGPESLVGETIVSVGVGGDPFTVTGGKVYITGPYRGAPFGLSIVNPAKAGPFDLGKVVVRAKIEVNSETAGLTITTDNEGPYKIPTIIDGIPLEIKHVNVDIDRPDFTFNATDCNPLAITGSLVSTEGSTSALSVPYQVTNCAVLGFKPKLEASTSGKTSRANGASLHVKLGYPAGPYDANIAKVKVELPKALPSRLTTLQKACAAAVFEANPAACPAASIVGHATASTPVLPVPLTGPAYFVSHGGEAFPSLIIVLQGYGVTVHLVGSTFINERTGITSSTFKTVPDVPVGSFELTLPEGPFSALAANGSLCKKGLAMPTEFVGQNGALIQTSTKIAVTGCAKTKHKAKKASKRHKGKHGTKGKGKKK